MAFEQALLIGSLTILGLATLLWLVSLAIRNVSIVDIFWGLGFVIIAWLTLSLHGEPTPRGWLLAILVTLWGARLSGYLAWRNLGHGEDRRYATMRERIGPSFRWKSLGIVFWLQAALICLVSLPVTVGIYSAHELSWPNLLGTAICVVGWTFESTADLQLAMFKRDRANQGQVLNRGLWRYSRHPNYFGDFLVWWGLFLIAVSTDSWWTVISPLVMSILLLRISGVTLLEKTMRAQKPAYEQYVLNTSTFFPWPPRKTDQ